MADENDKFPVHVNNNNGNSNSAVRPTERNGATPNTPMPTRTNATPNTPMPTRAVHDTKYAGYISAVHDAEHTYARATQYAATRTASNTESSAKICSGR